MPKDVNLIKIKLDFYINNLRQEKRILNVQMIYFYLATIICILFSFFKDRGKTYKAFKIAYKKFKAISSAFLTMLIFISIILYLVPNEMIIKYLGASGKFWGIFLSLSFGSITIMPGFVAFPLCGILLNKGISYMAIAAFSSSLMLVGVLTFPVEKAYLGVKVTIIRNVVYVILSLIIAFFIGIVYGELFI